MNTSPSNVLVRWHPTRNSAVALVTEAGLIVAYAILGQNSNNMGIAAAIGLLVVPILAVVIPVLWTLFAEHQGLSALGITSRRWLPSVLISVIFSLLILSPLLFASGFTAKPERWLPMAAAGAVALFEPLFIFGWLQLRVEKDFGILAAIHLAPFCYALYHIGYASLYDRPVRECSGICSCLPAHHESAGRMAGAVGYDHDLDVHRIECLLLQLGDGQRLGARFCR